MKYIVLTRGKSAIVDDEMHDLVSVHKWHYTSSGYAARWSRIENGNRKMILMHRVVANTPNGLCVDHVNGNPLDNRHSNLRNCTHAENIRNQKLAIHNTSGLKGVSRHAASGKFQAQIKFNKKTIPLGLYPTAESAYSAYCEAASSLHGEFARV